MLSVYIHIPFCRSICTYCDFCKMLYNEKYVDNYLDCLEKEIKERYHNEPIKTIYIGGGTPSSLTIKELERLLSIIDTLNLEDNYEYTIECNIEDINIDKINLFISYGINRISFGVESFDKSIQSILGRKHDEDTIFDNIYLTKTKEHIIEDGVKKSHLVKKGSLIFANCGVSLGFARIITFDGCIHDGWLAFENISASIDKRFLLLTLNMLTKYFRNIAPDGTQPNLNTSIMKKHKQIVPPLTLQKESLFSITPSYSLQISSQF